MSEGDASMMVEAAAGSCAAGIDVIAPSEEKALRSDGWTACVAAFDAQFNPVAVQHCAHFSLRQCHNVTCAKPHVKPPEGLLQAFVAAWPVVHQQKKKKKTRPGMITLGGVKPVRSAISKLPEALQARVLRAALRTTATLPSRPPVQMLPPPVQEMMVQVPMRRMQYLEQLEQQIALEQQSRQQAEAGWQQCEAAAAAQQQQHGRELQKEQQLRLQAEAEIGRLQQHLGRLQATQSMAPRSHEQATAPPPLAAIPPHPSFVSQPIGTPQSLQQLVRTSTPLQSQPQPMVLPPPQPKPSAKPPAMPEVRELRTDGWTACVAAFDAQFNPVAVQHCAHFSLRQCHNVTCAKPHVKPPEGLLQAFVAAWPVVHQQKKKKKPRPLPQSGPHVLRPQQPQQPPQLGVPNMMPTYTPITSSGSNFGFNADAYYGRHGDRQFAQPYPY